MDRTYVGGIERGERNVAFDNLCRLADALGVAPALLLKDVPPEPREMTAAGELAARLGRGWAR